MSVIVNCGNGGDWEWYNEKSMWEIWIEYNMPDTVFWTGYPDANSADKLCITFQFPEDDIIFRLKAPTYITYNMIKEICT